jgi:hypothetical protein
MGTIEIILLEVESCYGDMDKKYSTSAADALLDPTDVKWQQLA